MDVAFFDTWRPRALAILRIVTAYLFMAHGTAKLFGMPYQKMFDGLQLMSLPGLAGVLEVFGGLLILIGLFTRPAAFVLCGFMAVAYFMAHGSQGNVLLPMLNQGELELAQTMQQEISNLQQTGQISSEGQKTMKFGTNKTVRLSDLDVPEELKVKSE